MQLDVFTLVPHAFAWLTEQRPLAAVLGDELDLRLFNYRDFSPLRAGQVDDEPYGGGAGMVLRVDVAAAALDAVYGEAPSHRVVALTNAASGYVIVIPRAAGNYSSMSGVALEPCAEGGQELGQIRAGDWAIYPNVNLTGADTFVARLASGTFNSAIEIRLDSPTGTLIGALIMGVLRNGLNLLDVSSYGQQTVIGSVIIVAVYLDMALKKRAN